MPAERLLADTHTLVWFFAGAGIAPRQVKLLDAALAETRLMASAISLCEMGLLRSRGRLRRVLEFGPWVRRAVALGLVLLPLDPDSAMEAIRVPEGALHDPFDRLLVGTARAHGLRLVTRDGPILDYAAAGHVLALEI